MTELKDVVCLPTVIRQVRYNKHFSIHQNIARNKNIYCKTKRKHPKRNYPATRRTNTKARAEMVINSKKPTETVLRESTILPPNETQKRITFLIGNGFDLNIGLNTRYQDFYKYYIEKNPDDMLAKAIDENYDNWSDLELGLGQYTEKVLPENETGFWSSEQNLENNLVDYLKEEMKKINLDITERRQNIESKMTDSLLEFYKKLSDDAEKTLEQILADAQKQYYFITFNYTDALDQCVKIIRRSKKMIAEGDEVLHIHGTISDNMVLGVNDESQIKNQAFRNNTEYKELLIKKISMKNMEKETFKRRTIL